MHEFLADMAASGNLSKVVLMTFSEFGRRVYENNSFGTDHGAGNCMFVMGGKVNSGVYGGQPNLEEDSLLDGSLSHAIDFRSVYARIAQDWLKGDAEALFGADDFNDPVLDIQGGMEQLPIFDLAPPTIGDVNGDLNVDAIDIQFVINGALGQETGMETDINADEQTNAVDVQLVINAALGKKSIAKRNTAVPKSRAPRKRGNTPRLAGPVPEHMLGKKLR